MRAIQIGISGEAVERYVRDWIVAIENVTPIARALAQAAKEERLTGFPDERETVYPMSEAVRSRLVPA